MQMLEGAIRNLQNSRDPPSLTRAERIQELKKELKEEATKIGPAGPKLADNRYENEEECTNRFFLCVHTRIQAGLAKNGFFFGQHLSRDY